MDQNLATWLEQPPGVRTDSLLMEKMDFPRPAPQKQFEKQFEKPSAAGTKSEFKERCKTFNTYTVELKFDYEVANPGKTCILKHECSWCRDNLKQGFKHQLSKCRKRNQ